VTPRIKLSSEDMYDVARKFEQAIHYSNDIVSLLRATMSSLGAKWDGLENESFYQEYLDWDVSMINQIELLSRVTSELRYIAQMLSCTGLDRSIR